MKSPRFENRNNLYPHTPSALKERSEAESCATTGAAARFEGGRVIQSMFCLYLRLDFNLDFDMKPIC